MRLRKKHLSAKEHRPNITKDERNFELDSQESSTSSSCSSDLVSLRSSKNSLRNSKKNHPQSIEDLLNTKIKGQKKPAWRLSKRTLCITILTTIIVWMICPILFPSFRNVNFQTGLKFLYENALVEMLAPLSPISGDIVRNITSLLQPFSSHEEEILPGCILAKKGAKPHYPVFVIPGITSTALELWQGESCAGNYFRRRIWGTLDMFRLLVTDKKCWIRHLSLLSDSGLDPEGIKVRPALGLEAADFILPGYWVWGKIIENLAQIGYDSNNLHLASFDWRLAFLNMEKRDKYFTKLKHSLEISLLNSGKKAVVLTHSMGALVWQFFLKWAESDKGGQGGSKWVARHIHAIVNIAGPMLGCPKTVSAILSGESRESAQLGTMESYILELFFSKEQRRDLFRTWGGLLSLLPKGGNRIWGNQSGTFDLKEEKNGFMVQFDANARFGNYTADELPELYNQVLPKFVLETMSKNYSLGIAKKFSDDYDDPMYWSNPLETQLPDAPDLRIYCLYGVGKLTERAYSYKEEEPDKESYLDSLFKAKVQVESLPIDRSPLEAIHINSTKNDSDQYLHNGVYYTDGDGTVPIISNGFMCIKGWKNKKFNPAGIECVTKEYFDQPLPLMKDVRGGPSTSDHVDILGNHELTTDILLIASDLDHPKMRIHSKIMEIAERIEV